jgi:cation:H+ antiporter
MFLNILLLIVGFVLLIKGADFFVDGSSSTAQNFKVSKMLIALTIIAFGTSAPEFAVSMQALKDGSTDMVLGNVIGSCIMNILLILGVAAVINPVSIKSNTVKKEIPLIMLISTLLSVLFLDISLGSGFANEITRSDAVVILLFFTIFLYYLINLARKKKEENVEEKPQFPLGKSLIFVALGLIGIIIGSNMVVDNAIEIAYNLGISERLVALSVIAFGTSLPELITTIVSSKKGEQDLLLGNIIGSNIFNICIVLGIPVAIYGTITPSSFQMIDIVMLIASSIALFIFAESSRKITRAEGAIMLMAFAVYYTLVFVL